MSYRTELSSLEALASSLPFHLDESERVNEAFSAYMSGRRKRQKVVVDLWTYCYVRRYFLIKFIREAAFQASELDDVVEQTYKKVESSRGDIEHHERYAQWVSVVCRNTYINFVSRRHVVTPLEARHDRPVETIEILDLDVNAAALHLSLARAIERLPSFLQATARMKYIENLSYEEISRIIGKRVPTIRSYIHKICSRLRRDVSLQAWAKQYLE